jgi:hypothetical protein
MAIIHVCVPLMLARIFVKSIHKFPTTDENGCKKTDHTKANLHRYGAPEAGAVNYLRHLIT